MSNTAAALPPPTRPSGWQQDLARAGAAPPGLVGPPGVPTPTRLAAVLCCAFPEAEGPALLLTRRAAGLTRHAGEIAFPGGRIDPGDADGRAAALREAWEETALPAAAVILSGRLDDVLTSTGFRVEVHLARARAPAADLALAPAAAEVASLLFVPLAYILDPATRGRYDWTDRSGRARQGPAWRWQGAVIWGATAAMLDSLIRRWPPAA